MAKVDPVRRQRDRQGHGRGRLPHHSAPRSQGQRQEHRRRRRREGHRNSLSTFVKDKAYIAYVSGVSVGGGGQRLEVGHRYQVTISIGGAKVKRTVELQPNAKEAAVQRQLGL